MSGRKRKWGVVPLDVDVPKFTATVSPDDPEWMKLRTFWDSIRDLHRHEDTLFNSRLQIYFVGTSILVAGFVQIGDINSHRLNALAVCFSGIIFSAIMGFALRRTACAIQWYLRVLIDLDSALYDKEVRPYETRRRMAGGFIDGSHEPRFRPITVYLGLWIPRAITIAWFITGLIIFLFLPINLRCILR